MEFFRKESSGIGTICGLFPLPVIRMYGYFSFIMTSFNWTERISASRAPVENRNRIMKRSRTPIFVCGGCARSSSISALSSQLWRFGYECFHSRNADLQGTSSISRWRHISGVRLSRQPDIPCPNTVVIINTAQKFADHFFCNKNQL